MSNITQTFYVNRSFSNDYIGVNDIGWTVNPFTNTANLSIAGTTDDDPVFNGGVPEDGAYTCGWAHGNGNCTHAWSYNWSIGAGGALHCGVRNNYPGGCFFAATFVWSAPRQQVSIDFVGPTTVTYDGLPHSLTAVPSIAGVPVKVTYNGSVTPPTNAGVYTVVATARNPDISINYNLPAPPAGTTPITGYEGTVSTTLTILPKPEKLKITNSNYIYDGLSHGVTISTSPDTVPTRAYYNGLTGLPSGSGVYAVTAITTDPNYSGIASGQLGIFVPPYLTGNQTFEFNLGDFFYHRVDMWNGDAGKPTGLSQAGLPTGIYLHKDGTVYGSAIQTGLFTGYFTGTNYAGTGSFVATYKVNNPINRLYAYGSGSYDQNIVPLSLIGSRVRSISSEKQIYNAFSKYEEKIVALEQTIKPIDSGVDAYAINPTKFKFVISNITGKNIIDEFSFVSTASGRDTPFEDELVIESINGSVGTYKEMAIFSSGYGIVPDSTDGLVVGGYNLPSGITKQSASVYLTGLSQVCDGTPLSVTASTDPVDLGLITTYNGSILPPTGIGSYSILSIINDPYYTGSATGLLSITKKIAQIELASLVKTYNSGIQTPLIITFPTGLSTVTAYNGGTGLPSGVGTYFVNSYIQDSFYTGNNSGYFTINKLPATLSLSGFNRTYNGSSISVSGSTSPTGLSFTLNYGGQTSAPKASGSYVVVGLINNQNYSGYATGVLNIN